MGSSRLMDSSISFLFDKVDEQWLLLDLLILDAG